ncbi:putative methyltransferase-like protein 7A [Dermacentor silvarum]|uniref:putative methyltransferase-like protein 7A n=1 Tax=Dermacentor silvarum TaxID=543639 RepID=UPI002100ACF1|nr:putative methyltransferase-like protein 7A [Dermacentor silvarum]
MSLPTKPIAVVRRKWSRLLLQYALLAIIGISGILLMPLLIMSHRFQEKFFAFIYVIVQRFLNEEVTVIRQAVMSQLNEMSPQEPSSSVRGPLRVLEVGAAYGPNLEFIQRPVEYWTVEPNRSFEDSFMGNVERNSNVEMKQLITGHGEDMCMLPDGYFDAVVLVFVLCSAKDGSKLLSECKRVLKKGGRLLFAEHVAYKRGTFSRFIQDTLTPLTKKCAGGCHMNRESGSVLENAGFATIDINTVYLTVPVLLSNNIYGVAIA